MRVLVTGASGFVGSALCRRLIREGHSVSALSRDPERAKARVGAELHVVQGSIGNPQQVAEAARGAEVVFHAAGVPDLDAPARVLRWLHVAGSENVLRGARHQRVRRVVHISCANVSLTSEDRMHWDEKRVLASLPVGMHARSKLMAEELVLAHSDESLSVTALRPALLWGPDDIDGIARLSRALRAGEFRLYGGGRNIIATTHIDNLVTAALLAASAEAAAARPYYITDGEFLEAREFYTRLFSELGLAPLELQGSLGYGLAKARVRDLVRQNGDATRAATLQLGKNALFDLSKATLELGYEAQLDLDARMRELADWAHAEGGLDRILLRARQPPREADVDEQVRAAGGD